MAVDIIATIRKRFQYYKLLGDKALTQIDSTQMHWQPLPESNSVAVIVRHMAGNMRSRFTDFLSSDGEKPWRHRDTEFEDQAASKNELLQDWEMGWNCLFQALNTLDNDMLEQQVLIRSEPHTVLDALLRQLAHYSYHVGQLVYVCKGIAGEKWQTLSIPKGGSDAFNQKTFR
ncbi:MAG: DUF1572 family protein [Lewinellaceae bacterium]|nr:DUF1572 family protein [Lewinellaceae bacterium]